MNLATLNTGWLNLPVFLPMGEIDFIILEGTQGRLFTSICAPKEPRFYFRSGEQSPPSEHRMYNMDIYSLCPGMFGISGCVCEPVVFPLTRLTPGLSNWSTFINKTLHIWKTTKTVPLRCFLKNLFQKKIKFHLSPLLPSGHPLFLLFCRRF